MVLKFCLQNHKFYSGSYELDFEKAGTKITKFGPPKQFYYDTWLRSRTFKVFEKFEPM